MNNPVTTSLVGLIGFPVKHTLSPVIHNSAIKFLGLDAVYKSFEVRPRDVKDFLAEQPAGFLGTNVTIPHKQTVIESLDQLSPVAAATGAVNTVVLRQDEDEGPYLYGDNTDVAGFLAPLLALDSDHVRRLEGGRIVILGSGGAARAVAFAVREFSPQRITIVARNPMKGNQLVEELEPVDLASEREELPQSSVTTFDHKDLDRTISEADLIVNATPIGLTPNVHITPLPDATFLSSQIVYDLVYRPRHTRLLKDAARDGALVIDGLEMLLEQAAASFVQWFGEEMPMDVVREALDAELNR